MDATPSTPRRTIDAATTLLGLTPALAAGAPRGRVIADDPHESAAWAIFPRQRPDLVREVVGASHGRLETVRELVTAHPPLARSAWDWGFGDWESALGAASHTGQREIALLLIEHGARPDIFTFAMLGHLAAVKAIVEASPGIHKIRGPHDIPLLQHARAGGEGAKEVAAYLESLGGAGDVLPNVPLTSEGRAAYTGTYRVETAGAGNLTFEINEMQAGGGGDRLAFQRPGHPKRGLRNLGDHRFSPAGAPEVRLVFEMDSAGRGAAVTITDHGPIAKAVRVEAPRHTGPTTR